MILEYIEKAIGGAKLEIMENGCYFASISDFNGLWADGKSKTDCLKELRAAFEEWLVVALREDEELPIVEGVSLNFGGKRWSKSLADESL